MGKIKLSKGELLEYLRIAYGLETVLYNQNELISMLQNRISSNTMVEPQMPKEAELKSTGRGTGVFLIIAGLVGFFVLDEAILDSFILEAITICCLIIGVRLFFKSGSINSENKKRKERYQNEYHHYMKALHEYQIKRKITAICKSRMKNVTLHREEVKRYLEDLYSAEIIYPSYRGLIPVSTFIDYIESGRCDTLEGHEGAYNIYALESRLDKIITQLDSVIRHLEAIQQNQHMLYRSVQESQYEIARLTNALDGTNSELKRISDIESVNSVQLSKLSSNVALANYDIGQMRRAQELRNWSERHGF